jgi:pyruvate, orthophosphate dikinase
MTTSHDPARLFLVACRPDDTVVPRVEDIGGKALGLFRLSRLGVPVPPAVVLGTGWCREFQARGGSVPEDLMPRLEAALRYVEDASDLRFGSARHPLLVSVRSGAPVSMPGMMETVLNVGLSDATLSGFLRVTGNPRLVWDSYRRLVDGFAEVVAGLPREPFAALQAEHMARAGVARASDLDFRAQRELVRAQLALYHELAGEPFPQAPAEQLERALGAVLRSWQSDKARWFRDEHGIPEAPGTAVIVQRMVFGNAGADSGAGVGFTRDPSTGAAELFVDYAPNAQGEDVVSGRAALADSGRGALPIDIHERLLALAALLERELRDAQEFEFTVQDARLYVLQVREAKRTPLAALRIAVELAEAGSITGEEAHARLASCDLGRIEVASIDGHAPARLAVGVPAGSGIAIGRLIVDAQDALLRGRRGESVVLVRDDVATEDVAAIAASAGVLTRRGARTSHAAVVARQYGKPCVVACEALRLDAGGVRIGERYVGVGEPITIDGTSGAVYAGELRVRREAPTELLARLAALR